MRTRSFGIMFVYSIYGVVGDIERTAAIWNVAYRHTLGHGLPFIIGGDHNHEPSAFAERWLGPGVI
eukprot:561362-Heterocapsa_arctica.AAC.1